MHIENTVDKAEKINGKDPSDDEKQRKGRVY